MKRIIMFVLLFAALKVAGQTTGYLRFDTVKIMKQNGTCELYIINKTKDSLGLLTNVGGGLTRFIKPKMLNDSAIIIGLDTIVIHGSSGGQNLANSSLTANGDYAHNWSQHPLKIDSIADTLRLSMFTPNSNYPNNNFRFNLNANNSTVTPFALEWGLSDIFGSPDSAYAGLTSSSLGTVINHWSNNGSRFSTIEVNGGFNQPYLSLEANNEGSKSRIYMDKSVYIMGDSTSIKAVPAATADSSLGIRKTRLFNGMEVSTVVKFPVPAGGGSGVTTMQAIGSSPNANGATISGVNLTLQPASASFGGVVTTTSQSIAGDKTFYGKRTNFYGHAPILHADYIPTAVTPDSFYIANRYLGFGFINTTASGAIVQFYIDALNHVGDSGRVKMRKSLDHGRTWASTTVLDVGADYFWSGLSGGITQTNRIVLFAQRLDNITLVQEENVIVYSDDEGTTWSSQNLISHNSEAAFNSYGPLCKIGGDSLLLSWYGITTGTYSSYVIKSGDDGVTWSSPITIISSSASQNTETSVTYIGGSTLIALARREQADSAYGQFISRDNGSTWTYQGKTSFGQSGTPAWTQTFKSKNGRRAMVAYYRIGGYTSEVRAVYGMADSIALGPQYWDMNTEVVVVPVTHGNAYFNASHHHESMNAIGWYYDETVLIDDATIKYKLLPIGEDMPIGEKLRTVAGGANFEGGYLGINNSVPEAMIDIKGFESKTGAAELGLIVTSNNASNRFGGLFTIGNDATAGNRYFGIQSQEMGIAYRNMALNPNGGNVGIGTTAASSPLHVTSATSGAGGYVARFIDNNSTNGSVVVFGYSGASGSNTKYKALFVDGNGFNLGTLPDALNASPTAIMTIDNSTFGRVGFGVTSPLASVHIKAGSTFAGTAPIKVDSGALNTVAQPGALEYNGHWYLTDRTGLRTQIDGSQWAAVTGGINYTGGFVGINNAAPEVYLDVKGAEAKSGAEDIPAIFGSSDASNPLTLRILTGNNATAGSRGMGLQSIEQGVAQRALWLNPDGANVLIGTRTNGSAKLQVNGAATVADEAYDATAWNGSLEVPTKNAVRDKIESMGSSTTIYTGDGTLSGNRTVSTGGFTTTWSGTNDSETSFSVTNSGSTAASAINGTGGGNGTGVQGESSSGIGVAGISATGAAFRGQINPSSNNAIENIHTLLRTSSSGAGANGLGAAIQYELETATNGTSQIAGSIAFQWTDATNATRTSQFEIYGVNSTTTARKAALAGNGQWTWDGYGQATHSVTPATTPVVSSTGVVGERIAPKIYTALLTQSGTSDPTATVLGTNEIGSIVWTRNSTGNYTGTLTGAFTANKTWLLCAKGDGSGSFVNGLLYRTGNNTVVLDVRDNNATLTDSYTNMSIEIRVYP